MWAICLPDFCKFLESLKNYKCVWIFSLISVINALNASKAESSRCRCCVKIFETRELLLSIIMIFPLNSNQIWHCAIKSHPNFIRLWILPIISHICKIFCYKLLVLHWITLFHVSQCRGSNSIEIWPQLAMLIKVKCRSTMQTCDNVLTEYLSQNQTLHVVFPFEKESFLMFFEVFIWRHNLFGIWWSQISHHHAFTTFLNSFYYPIAPQVIRFWESSVELKRHSSLIFHNIYTCRKEEIIILIIEMASSPLKTYI